MKKRIFAVLLSLAMLISMTPASVFAAAPETAAPAEPETVEPEAPAAPMADTTQPENPGAVVASGSCGAIGSSVQWTLYENGLLAITGTGEMKDYSEYSMPWYSRQDQIKTVTIGDGVTGIGWYAFSGCNSLESAQISASVTSIDYKAFYKSSSLKRVEFAADSKLQMIDEVVFSDCTSLESIQIPDSVTSIGGYAFYKCSSLVSVEIPSGVTSIGDSAFSYCTSLVSIEIPSGVTSIEDSAFSGCSSLGSIEIPASVTSIDNYAFGYCSSLWKVRFLGNLPKVGWYAFCDVSAVAFYPEGNTTYQDVSASSYDGIFYWYSDKLLPDGVLAEGECGMDVHWTLTADGLLTIAGTGEITSAPGSDYKMAVRRCVMTPDVTYIVDSAFNDYNHLQSVSIPASVTGIGNSAFYDCSSLKEVEFAANSQLQSIGDSAFEFCSGLTSVDIPSNVTSIEDSAFSYCSSLERVEFGDGSKLQSIGMYAFCDCSSLGSVEIPASVTSIRSSAFFNCSSLTAIHVDAGNMHYSGDESGVLFNKNKTELLAAPGALSGGYTIPDSVTRIENSAFSYCSSLERVEFGADSKLESIGNSAFFDCSSLESIRIPDSVTGIGSSTFWGCSSLTSIGIPSGVTGIEDHAFQSCSSLVSVEIPDSVTSIGWSAFGGCSSLESIRIPENVTRIENSAFSGCSSLRSIRIPESVTSIGAIAFCDCTGLGSIEIPASVTSIGSSAFSGCSSLTAIHVDAGNAYYSSDDFGVLFNKAQTELLAAPGALSGAYTIPASVTNIGVEAFNVCSSLESIQIPASVTNIGEYAFSGCTGMWKIRFLGSLPAVGELTFSGVSTIAFYPAGNATYENVSPYFGGGTIQWCTDERLSEGVLAEGACGTDAHWTLTADGLLMITGAGEITGSSWRSYQNYIKRCVIASGVTGIGEEAFYCCGSLESVEFEADSHLQSIGPSAFFGCYMLSSIDLPSGMTSIGDGAFYDCNGLISVKIPASVTSIGGSAFARCGSLGAVYVEPDNAYYSSDDRGVLFDKYQTELLAAPGALSGAYAIPASVTGIASEAFSGCVALTSVEIPSNLTSIGYGAFSRCFNLKSVVIPSGVTRIDDTTFSSCTHLEQVKFSADSRLGSIGYGAFSGCGSLSSLEIPAGVISVESEAFFGCGLKSVRFLGKPDMIDAYAFYGVTTLVYYCADDGWGDLANQNYGGELTWIHNSGITAEVAYPEDPEGPEGGELTLHVNAPMEEFVGVYVDGQLVDPENYDVTEGSTVITFHEDYLRTLSGDEHTFTVNFDGGGQSEVTLTLRATILGDADGDGELTASDLARMRRYIAGLEDGLRLEVLDLDGDGDVTATDLVKLSRRIAGLE